ncbi:NAD(P)/FAD-dependent oxidoreductase [Afifella sp. IM 167]|uniref:NAD(P)/FAD-dependent oxidoreductase n=1 Tax=Afifella sp. IM 167 TaxID=2033586 RepID=UPI001CCD3998|nr:FAD-dependent oxidoreductase [Afifella sp. IM 167]
MRIAIIGAGMAGLAAGRRLKEAGADALVLERNAQPGGRLASVEVAGALTDAAALYATAREPAFKDFMQSAVFSGHATGWAPKGRSSDEPWLIGLPTMNALSAFCAEGLDLRTGTAAERIGHASEGYIVQTADAGPIGPFDAVIVAIAAPAAGPLLKAHGKPFERIGAVVMRPTLAGVFAFSERLPIDADFIAEAATIGAAARNASRAGRAGEEVWIVHGSADFSAGHFEESDEAVAEKLLEGLGAAAGSGLPAPAERHILRYPQARVETALGEPFLAGGRGRLVACGDWCLGPRLEAAFISGTAAAEAVLSALAA